MRIILHFFICVVISGIGNIALGQNYQITGYVKNIDNGEAIPNANIKLTPGDYNTTSDNSGFYQFDNVSLGTYTITVSEMNFKTSTKEVNVSSNQVVNLELSSTNFTTETIEINRAKDRETPVAFSDITKDELEEKNYGQDAPLLVKGTPGLYSFSTDGVGNGESQLLIRGFSQNYVQVLINGIPTNDPESNAVYWSNWGSVSSNAGSIQIQRGAGSSLYGSGSFGGSFNILTDVPSLKPFYGLNLSVGDPMSTMYGLKLSSGLVKGKFSGTLNIDRKVSEGSRISGRYEGVNYYANINFFPDSKQNLKGVLHGAPQQHGYSFSNNIAYFKKFGYTANSAPFLPISVVEQLPVNATTGDANYGILNSIRNLSDDEFVNISTNFFHKPQAELHYSIQLNKVSMLKSTFFFSLGRGGGSSINSSGTVFSLRRGVGSNGKTVDTLTTNLLGADGYIESVGVADTVYLRNAFQRISYSLHQQLGLLTSYQTQIGKNLNITAGAEFRNWSADHPGHFTNLFGKTSVTQRYAAVDSAGNLVNFSRTVTQGDLVSPDGIGYIFGWKLANDPTYQTQYRNYLGETPQLTLFTQGNFIYEKFNIMASLQYVWYNYKLTENMPSENAIGRRLSVDAGITTEGAVGDKFYMKGTDNRFYEFDLVRSERSRGFFQPKFGINFNATENLNIFGNFAHVERFVDLGTYYNQGRINEDAEDEKSNQFELGLGWGSEELFAKVNGYYMFWENKSARIQDITQAGQPGYDRNGFRNELIGTSEHKGIEFELNYNLDKILSIKGFDFSASFTFMDNKWKTVLDEVKTEVVSGVERRRAFNTGALDENGNVDTLYFDELEGTPVASGPQLMTSFRLGYKYKGFFTGLNMNYYAKDFLLDGGTYSAVDGSYIGTDSQGRELFESSYDNVLPSRAIFDLDLGYNFNFKKTLKGSATIQVLNIADTEYLSAADRFGVIPGVRRTFRFNLSLGL